jgi:hypothetical protein
MHMDLRVILIHHQSIRDGFALQSSGYRPGDLEFASRQLASPNRGFAFRQQVSKEVALAALASRPGTARLWGASRWGYSNP